jgi:hypothetical protein
MLGLSGWVAVFWNFELYLGYSWDSGFIRNGKPGSSLLLALCKSF